MNALVKETAQSGPWEIMGSLFKQELQSEADVLGLIEKGISTKNYQFVVKCLDVPKGAIGAETTIRNRLRGANSRLNAEESERLVGIARVFASARSLFGTDEKALLWMHRPAKYLPDKPPVTPMTLATRDAGVRLLEEKLIRTAHGMY